MTDIPIIVTAAGLQPTPPAVIRADIVTAVEAVNPGYTADLPSSMVEDILSTDVAAVAECDSAKVETVNSLTPYGANAFLLNQLGILYGVQYTSSYYTSVYVVFAGTVGWLVAQGYTVSDGTYQYTVQDGGIIGSGGTTIPLFCIATVVGTWAVPTNTVNQIVTSFPSTITLTVNNQVAGTPGSGAQTEAQYRQLVLQAGRAVAQGMATFLKTTLNRVPGVQPRLISALQQTGGGWEIITGGGDPYQVAYALYKSLFDISTLVGSTLSVTGITRANPGKVTTNLNNGYVTGQVIEIEGVVGAAWAPIFNTPLSVTVVDEKNFTIGVDTSGYATAYTSGGVVTPNLRNVFVSIQDYPNTYLIPFVNPPQQTVTMTVTWNTTATNVVSQLAMAQAGGPAIVDYVNNLPVGVPMNLFEMQTVFQAAVANIVSPQNLTRLVFSVDINGVGVPVSSGTGIFAGDPESYFETNITEISVVQG